MRENTINRGDVRATQESHKDSDFLYTTDKEVHSLAFIVRYQFLKKSFIIFEKISFSAIFFKKKSAKSQKHRVARRELEMMGEGN